MNYEAVMDDFMYKMKSRGQSEVEMYMVIILCVCKKVLLFAKLDVHKLFLFYFPHMRW